MERQFKKKAPLISVIMPVFNAEDFLVEAIESILNQTYTNFEFIIINDSSTDKSAEIIRKYQKLDKRIKVIQTGKNLNCGGDRCANLGLEMAKGKYIARMDADDVAHIQRIEKQLKFLENNPDIFLVGTNAYVINKKGDLMGEKLEPESCKEIKKAYFTFHPLIHPTCMYRRVLFKQNVILNEMKDPKHISQNKRFFAPLRMTTQKTFKYQIKYSANNDYYTFFKLLCQGYKFANLSEKLLYFRIHGANDTFVDMREKYLNTLKARINMVLKYNYKPNIKDLIITVLQTGLVFLLPERVLTYIYLVAKGIKKPFLFPKIFKSKFMNHSFIPDHLSGKAFGVSSHKRNRTSAKRDL